MKVDDPKTCSVCGIPLSAASEFCPACMLRIGLEGKVGTGGCSSEAAPDNSTQSELKVRRLENYEVVRREDGTPFELGRGAMGITYKAFDVDLRCLVTLKVINARYLNDESARLRFLREARAAASLRHPNVASVLHLGRTGNSYFYAMEFVEGETLESLIRRSGRLEVNLTLEIAAQVSAGLAAVHEQKLVHRDIKPANIMVSLKDANRVIAKIIDLGLSKAVAESPSQPAISMPGAFAGTPEFASPEQFAGIGTDIRSDLYSVGVTLWQMLTGKVPFQGTPAEVMYEHQHTPLPLEQLIQMPQPIVVLLRVLLQKDPKRRFQNPTELVNALRKVDYAIKAGRSITDQDLQTITPGQVPERSKAASLLPRLKTVVGTRNAHLILWAALALLAAGGLAMIKSTFFTAGHPIPDASIAAPNDTKIPEKSIAVLPFESLSDNKSDTYFADGVQDEILSNLAKVSQLKVISRTSVMTYRSTNDRNLRSIGNALGVANVVEGTVRRDGNRVRVTTELVDARTDQTLWSDSYDRDLIDIFAIQSDIAQTVASKLSARLSLGEKQGMQEKPTENLEAYDLYLQAKASITNTLLSVDSGKSRQAFLDAIALLEQATRRDPAFALAYCQIAKADNCLYALRLDITTKRRLHDEAAVKEALRLKPDLPEAHIVAGYFLYTCYRDYKNARTHILIAERASPNSAEALTLSGYIDRGQGGWSESTKAFERAYDLDPKNPEILNQLGANYGYIRHYRDQERIYNSLIEVEPDNPSVKLLKAMTFFDGKADMSAWRAALEALPPSMKNDQGMFPWFFEFSVLSRDWTKATDLVRSSSNDELPLIMGTMLPRPCLEIPIAKYRGENPEKENLFVAARDQLSRKVEEHPEDPYLLCSLGQMDAYLGRKQEAIQEAQHAVAMLPDAIDGPILQSVLATVYALTNEPDLAFKTLDVSIKTPRGISYGDLKLDPDWDALRSDPRFDKLLAQLAPVK
jgi:serine/threonine protein kinase/tetratricopeptide (TPR) repeat protein